jgi:hypothetical protein
LPSISELAGGFMVRMAATLFKRRAKISLDLFFIDRAGMEIACQAQNRDIESSGALAFWGVNDVLQLIPESGFDDCFDTVASRGVADL